jgi:hypothetical protein
MAKRVYPSAVKQSLPICCRPLVKYGKTVDDPSFDVENETLTSALRKTSQETRVDFVETPPDVVYMAELHQLPMTLTCQ